MVSSRVPPVADWYFWNASAGTNIRRQRVVSLSTILTRGNKNKGSASVYNTGSRIQDSDVAVRN